MIRNYRFNDDRDAFINKLSIINSDKKNISTEKDLCKSIMSEIKAKNEYFDKLIAVFHNKDFIIELAKFLQKKNKNSKIEYEIINKKYNYDPTDFYNYDYNIKKDGVVVYTSNFKDMLWLEKNYCIIFNEDKTSYNKQTADVKNMCERMGVTASDFTNFKLDFYNNNYAKYLSREQLVL